MEVVHAILLGIVQGITEFLPISSSGHLIIVSWFMDGKPLPLALNVALHVGTLLAILIYFWIDFWAMAKGSLKALRERKMNADVRLLSLLILASVPAGLIGVLWEDDIERLFHQPSFVAFPLAGVGLLLWWVDRRYSPRQQLMALTSGQAFLIGCAQACALIPGTSRSGATILAGRWLGLDRTDAARFSFLLGTPAMFGAAVLKSNEILESIGQPEFYVGMLASAAVGWATIRFLLYFLKRYGFGAFALYRLALAGVILVLLRL